MAFVQITDPDKAMELYQAGLLWEKRLYGGGPYDTVGPGSFCRYQSYSNTFGLLLED